MKTTVDLPDDLFRRAKAADAQQRKTLQQFLIEAVADRLQRRRKPWASAFGGMKHLHAKNLRIQRIISKEFDTIDEEQWR